MGKWSHLDLPDKPQEPSERTTKLFAQVDALKGKPLEEIAAELLRAKDAKAYAATLEKTANFDIEAADLALRQAMKDQRLDSAVMLGYRFTPSPEPYPQVTDKHALLEWALEHMRDNLNLHPSTLSAVVKAALETGAELPPGVDAFMSSKISATKSKG